MEKNNTPAEAIQSFCYNCVKDDRVGHRANLSEVRNCKGYDCPFYTDRLGRNGKASVKTIRKMCLECMGECKKSVKECENFSCALHPYRMGKNPNYEKKFRGA